MLRDSYAITISRGRAYWLLVPIRWWHRPQLLMPFAILHAFMTAWNTIACCVLGHADVELIGHCVHCRFSLPAAERHAKEQRLWESVEKQR